MKKYITSFLLTLAFSIGLSSQAFAASFGVSMSGEEVFENSTTITVSVNGYDGIDGYCQGLCAAVMTLSYDSSKISVTPSALNGFSLTSGSRLVLDRATGVPSGTAILLLTVNNVGLAANESTAIGLTNITGSDSDVNATAGSVSKTVTLKASAPASQPEQTSNSSSTPSSNPAPSASTTTPSNASSNNSTKTPESKTETETENKSTDASANSKTSSNKKDKSPITISTDGQSSQEAQQEENSNPIVWIIIVIIVIIILAGALSFFFIYKKKNNKKIQRLKNHEK